MTSANKKLNEWLASLEDERGRLTPEEVIEAARDPESPGHVYFDWDDSTAAHKWRLTQARNILSVRVVIQTSNASFKAPRYVHDPSVGPAQQMYVSTRHARTDDELKRDIIYNEMVRIESLLERVMTLSAYFNVQDEVQGVVNTVRQLQLKIQQSPAGIQ